MSAVKRKKGSRRFIGIPYNVAATRQFCNLKPLELKLLVELAFQYNGSNNGNLTAAHASLKERGWTSSGSLHKALKGLLSKGWVMVTRQGWKRRGRPTLLALTWEGIDELRPSSAVTYDEGIKPSHSPLNYWCKHPKSWEHLPPCLQKNSSQCE